MKVETMQASVDRNWLMLNRIATTLGVSMADEEEVLEDVLPTPLLVVEELEALSDKLTEDKAFRKKLVCIT